MMSIKWMILLSSVALVVSAQGSVEQAFSEHIQSIIDGDRAGFLSSYTNNSEVRVYFLDKRISTVFQGMDDMRKLADAYFSATDLSDFQVLHSVIDEQYRTAFAVLTNPSGGVSIATGTFIFDSQFHIVRQYASRQASSTLPIPSLQQQLF